jgi:hypothetical protein
MKLAGNEALVKGVFTPQQAIEILVTLFQSKIQMHNSQSFSSLVRTGSESPEDNSRVKELTTSLRLLTEMIREADDTDTAIQIDCKVKLKLRKRKVKTRHVQRPKAMHSHDA